MAEYEQHYLRESLVCFALCGGVHKTVVAKAADLTDCKAHYVPRRYTALYLVAWSPTLWSIGYALLEPPPEMEHDNLGSNEEVGVTCGSQAGSGFEARPAGFLRTHQ